jgi:diguanylate cyclase (GGDEF)-like protein
VGDQVLKALARIIHTHIRGGDVLARTGGEEFVLLLADASLESAQHICERIRAAIESNDWEKLSAGLRLTSSIGLAARTVDDSLDTLIARADVALYAAKNGGRNRVQVAA